MEKVIFDCGSQACIGGVGIRVKLDRPHSKILL